MALKAPHNDPFILELIRRVGAHYGKPLASPAQFDRLQADIELATRERLSVTTLKRMWGYIEGWQLPRISTLNIRARYCGSESYAAFCRAYSAEGGVDSGFSEGLTLHAGELTPGQQIQLRWLPDREVRLEYKGDMQFEVLENINSKLREGWMVSCACFVQGEPLYGEVFDLHTQMRRPYIAGKQKGITFSLIAQVGR